MTTPTNARQTSERERLVLPMTASTVPHPMYASGWNACLDSCKEVLDSQQAEIAALRAENEALRTALCKVRAHTGHTKAFPDQLHMELLTRIAKIVDEAFQSFIRSKEARRATE